MKIDSLSSNRSTTLRRSNGASTGKPGAFVKALSAEPPATPAVAGGSGPGPLEALLALQEVPDPLVRRRQAAKRGAELQMSLRRSGWVCSPMGEGPFPLAPAAATVIATTATRGP